MTFLRRLSGHWAARSMGSGIVSTAIDVLALVACVKVLHLAAAPASALGVALGAVAGFVLNKYVAFRDRVGPVLPQLAKYAATLAAAMAVHASLMYLLADRLGVHFLVAKLVADFLVFTCGTLSVMRFFIFRPPPTLARTDGE